MEGTRCLNADFGIFGRGWSLECVAISTGDDRSHEMHLFTKSSSTDWTGSGLCFGSVCGIRLPGRLRVVAAVAAVFMLSSNSPIIWIA